uniref:Band 7 domain-containing protein n=1 Tax=uncultured bacterium contig00030 TaxID=1181519 RepID=A0A806KEC2_9BACT|nr:hypothetical protein [uncultured bacterium contig00030]
MKKFFFTLLILLILGGAAFFFGWVQFAVPPGSYGVITSKTHGVDPLLVRSGEFRWLWYKLIPTNVKIAVFNLEPVHLNVNFNNTLPSGDSYASFAGIGGADFSWDLRSSISFNINPDMLVQLASQHNLSDQHALDAYIQNLAANIEVNIMRILDTNEIDNSRLENILSGNHDTELEREIAGLFPEIRDFTFTVQSAKVPDFILYRQVRLLYEEFLSKQREVITMGFGARAETHITAQLKLDELERYGELLTKYPVLLDYLTLENIKP